MKPRTFLKQRGLGVPSVLLGAALVVSMVGGAVEVYLAGSDDADAQAGIQELMGITSKSHNYKAFEGDYDGFPNLGTNIFKKTIAATSCDGDTLLQIGYDFDGDQDICDAALISAGALPWEVTRPTTPTTGGTACTSTATPNCSSAGVLTILVD